MPVNILQQLGATLKSICGNCVTYRNISIILLFGETYVDSAELETENVQKGDVTSATNYTEQKRRICGL
jgi:hypothetical protein